MMQYVFLRVEKCIKDDDGIYLMFLRNFVKLCKCHEYLRSFI